MPTPTNTDIWSRILEGSWSSLSEREAEAILRLKFNAKDQRRVAELGLMAQEASLSRSQKEKLDQYLNAGLVLTQMKLPARRSIRF